LIHPIAQIATHKAAFTNIDEWLNNDDEDRYHQIVLDLNLSLPCCVPVLNDRSKTIEEIKLMHLAASIWAARSTSHLTAERGRIIEELLIIKPRGVTMLLIICQW
jgi:hypothetical protein